MRFFVEYNLIWKTLRILLLVVYVWKLQSCCTTTKEAHSNATRARRLITLKKAGCQHRIVKNCPDHKHCHDQHEHMRRLEPVALIINRQEVVSIN